MKITIDHNVIIDLANGSRNVQRLKARLAADSDDAYVVEIGASEMRERGISPDRYDLFEELLREAGVDHLPRLTPMVLLDITFYHHCLYANDEMIALSEKIESILFGNSRKADHTEQRRWLNRICDTHTMWCHIHYGNDVFVTSDKNFLRASKLPRLLELGARRVCTPCEL